MAFATAGDEPERFGIGPVPAIRKALTMAGRKLPDRELSEFVERWAKKNAYDVRGKAGLS